MKILKLLSVIALLFSAAATFAQHSGTTGPLAWSYNTQTDVLTITGEGAMPDYELWNTPWNKYSPMNQDGHIVSEVIIGNGVTSIGRNAFTYLSLTSVTIGNSVTSIGDYAFQHCSFLTEFTIPNSVTTIGVSAFQYASHVTSVSIGNSVTTIGNSAFGRCLALTEVLNYAVTPQLIDAGVFGDVNLSACTLHVHGNSREAYLAADVWKDFGNFETGTFVAGVELNKTELSLYIDSSETLEATVLPAGAYNQTVTWSSNNPAVATVDQTGLVTAVSKGEAVITATTEESGFTATCTLTVMQPVIGVFLSNTKLPLNTGETETLVATVLPTNADNQNITWSSNTPAVATVDQTGLVTAVTAGTATITVTTEEGGFTAACTVTVTQPATGISLNNETLSLNMGATETLEATVAPADAGNRSVRWLSSTPAVAAVDAAGQVTAVSAGTAVIIASTVDSGFTAVCNVTVTQSATGVTLNVETAELDIAQTFQLVAAVTPETATNKSVTFGSDNDAVATVSATGLVTAVAAGTAAITVTTAEGGFTATCEVTVKSSGDCSSLLVIIDALKADTIRLNNEITSLITDTLRLSGDVSKLITDTVRLYELLALCEATSSGDCSPLLIIIDALKADTVRLSNENAGLIIINNQLKTDTAALNAEIARLNAEIARLNELLANCCGDSINNSEDLQRLRDSIDWLNLLLAECGQPNIALKPVSDLEINIYPNPVVSQLHIEILSNFSDYSSIAELYDMTGKRVYLGHLPSSTTQFTIDMTTFRKGHYILRIGNRMAKIIKK